MAITISAAEVKSAAGIPASETSHDAAITSLIASMQPALEYSIADAHLQSPDTGLQMTLKLGLVEMLAGEYLERLRRSIGGAEEFSIAGVSVGAAPDCGLELAQQGAARLQPYLRAALPGMSEAASHSSTADSAQVFSREEAVW